MFNWIELNRKDCDGGEDRVDEEGKVCENIDLNPRWSPTDNHWGFRRHSFRSEWTTVICSLEQDFYLRIRYLFWSAINTLIWTNNIQLKRRFSFSSMKTTQWSFVCDETKWMPTLPNKRCSLAECILDKWTLFNIDFLSAIRSSFEMIRRSDQQDLGVTLLFD